MAGKHLFLLPKETMINLLSNGITHVDYAYSRKIEIGDNVTLKEYIDTVGGYEPMRMEGVVKTIEPLNNSKYNMSLKRFGLNIQLIMF